MMRAEETAGDPKGMMIVGIYISVMETETLARAKMIPGWNGSTGTKK